MTVYEPPLRYEQRVAGRLEAATIVTPLEDGRSRVEWWARSHARQLFGPLSAALSGMLIRRGFRRDLRRLKAYVEAEASHAP